MMDFFSRRQWKKWAYGRLHASRALPKARVPATPAPESEYPGWLLPALVVGILVLMLIYAFVLR